MLNRPFYLHASEALFVMLSQTLASLGWQALPARSMTNGKLNEHSAAQVGLFQIQNGSEEECHKLDELMTHNGVIEWIALVSPEALLSSFVCNLITERFYDYHTLPVDSARLSAGMGHAHGKCTLLQQGVVSAGKAKCNGMIGSSPIMFRLHSSLRKTSRVDAPVLIGGESGTGKELAARAIHSMSARGNGPFVAVNCGALPTHLIQTELFGHEKGAFTGAYQRKIGRMEAAAGGTIFLDEIGDLPLELQVNLLHVLQEKFIERVGSCQKISLDVRVIAATHVDLEQAVAQGRFREDLYYRLNVIHLKVPPLRERDGDVKLLAQAFFEKFSNETHSTSMGFSRQTLQVMNNYRWPGNVRELFNRVRQAVVMSENRLLTPNDLGLEKRVDGRLMMTLNAARAQAEHEAIRLSLRRNQNNISGAARQLGVSRATLYRLLERHGPLPPDQPA
jgi:DNA-binding NtrC family response regulator